jgi:hypothetical protein
MLSYLKTLKLFASFKVRSWLQVHPYLSYEDRTGKCLLRQAPQQQTPDLGDGPRISKNTDVRSLALLSTTGNNPATLSALPQSAI